MNDHWKVLYKLSVFYADRKSKMAALIVLTQDHMRKIQKYVPAVVAILDFPSA
jgi:hypothetical protein